MSFPPDLTQFVSLFNGGQFWESHEVLETPWRQNRSDFYQGLIIVASAFVHAKRGNPRGVVKQLTKALRYLDPYPGSYLGLDVAWLRAESKQWLAVAGKSPQNEPMLQPEQVSPLVLRLSLDHLRGDEVELAERSE